ncbi:NAD(P) transhydrogenase subunit alpha [Actinoplanes sp. NPDC049599]|uniref:NAD(P) transhydrogenase subunit alpha n=1 Tax=Actinoplanes sp. NPDC049599 TaxID=3363903 RepID=UPI0037A9DD66
MTTTVGVVRETAAGERRVALTPDGVQRLRALGLEVRVEAGAGEGAFLPDADYAAAGAVLDTRAKVYADSDVLVCVHPPGDVEALRPGRTLVGLLFPVTDPGLTRRLAEAKITAVSLDLLPRTLSRAQAMDALTSQAAVAGYKAALVAAAAYAGYFPMLMTAAGTTRPAQVLVLGAGVAGLQAIATSRRLGAVVTGYDIRPAAHADIASTGATVLELPDPGGTGEGGAGEGGYARRLTDAEALAQRQALDAAIARFDIVITTAQVPGRPPPLLVSADALEAMRPGSVVVDLAAGALGGNVAGSEPGGTVVTGRGVTLIGAADLAATVPAAASTAYARNLCALLPGLLRDGVVTVDLDDEIQAAVVVTHDGDIVNPRARAAAEEESGS